jgi:signal transduction histidine kinase
VSRSAVYRTDRGLAARFNAEVNTLLHSRTHPFRFWPAGASPSPHAPEAELERLEAMVSRQTAQLIALTQHLQTVREEERGRLARDLHDELGSLLTSAKLDAARLRTRLSASAPDALPLLAHLVTQLDSGIQLKRSIVEALQPSTLSTLGLAEALEILARDFAQQSGIAVHRTLDAVTLAPTAALVVYRLVQEAITNITKYAQPKHVWISVTQNAGRVVVTVRDDGVGFDPTAVQRSAYGLMGMRYRVEAEHGTLTVESAPGRGTLLRASLPGGARSLPPV